MSENIIKITHEGEPCDAEVVEIVAREEHTNEYVLSDKTRIRLRPTTIDIIKLLGKQTADGEDIYMVKSHNVLNVIKPKAKDE